MKTLRYCFACDLKDNPELIEEYRSYHAKGNTWPEITKSIKDSGVIDMEIYLTGNRLIMVMEVDDSYSHDRKNKMDKENPKVQEWEELMWQYQQELPWAKKGVKWISLEKIFKLDD